MKTEKIITILGIIFFTLLGGLGGIIGGYFWGIQENALPVTIEQQDEKEVPTLTLQKIENGILSVKNNGSEIRVRTEDAEINIIKNGENTIDVVGILPMLKKVPAPEWANFVASKRGSKYWPLDSYQAFSLSPKNRVFYGTEEDAKKDGKEKGKL